MASTTISTMLGVRSATSSFSKCLATSVSVTISKRVPFLGHGNSLLKFSDSMATNSGSPFMKVTMKQKRCGTNRWVFRCRVFSDSAIKTTFGKWAIPALADHVQKSTSTEGQHLGQMVDHSMTHMVTDSLSFGTSSSCSTTKRPMVRARHCPSRQSILALA